MDAAGSYSADTNQSPLSLTSFIHFQIEKALHVADEYIFTLNKTTKTTIKYRKCTLNWCSAKIHTTLNDQLQKYFTLPYFAFGLFSISTLFFWTFSQSTSNDSLVLLDGSPSKGAQISRSMDSNQHTLFSLDRNKDDLWFCFSLSSVSISF